MVLLYASANAMSARVSHPHAIHFIAGIDTVKQHAGRTISKCAWGKFKMPGSYKYVVSELANFVFIKRIPLESVPIAIKNIRSRYFRVGKV